MKVLFVITGLGVGGAERQVVDLATRLVQLNHQVKICYLTGSPANLSIPNQIELIGLGVRKSVWGFFMAYAALRRVILRFQPDVVHSHMVHANILSRLVRLTTPIARLVCTAHSTNEGGKLRML